MNSPKFKSLISSGVTYSTTLKIKSDPVSSNFQVSFVARENKIDQRVLVLGSSETSNLISALKVGDQIQVQGYLSDLTQYQKYRAREHIVGTFKVLEVTKIQSSNGKIDLATQVLRDTIEKGCSRLGKDERGVCEGLLIGKRNSISKSLYDTYRKAQLTHLLVASGANIAFLVGFLNPIVSKVGKRFSSYSLIGVALFYCAATRFEPSILRASVMVILPTILSLNGFVVSKFKVFVLTLFFCAVLDPFLIFRVGFWLSLSATGGLFFVAPRIKKYCKSEIIRNTLAATICVQPTLWLVFGFAFPVRWWASVISIAIAEPLTTVGMVLVAVLSLIHPSSFISEIGIAPMNVGCKTLNYVAKLGASPSGYWIGWALTILPVFAYTIRYAKCRNGRFPDLLHYRR